MMVKRIVKFIKWWLKEQDSLCPHCGYYCIGESVYCLPPEVK